jgi:hypothetical protein
MIFSILCSFLWLAWCLVTFCIQEGYGVERPNILVLQYFPMTEVAELDSSQNLPLSSLSFSQISFLNVYSHCQRFNFAYKRIDINGTLFEEKTGLNHSWIKLFGIYSFLTEKHSFNDDDEDIGMLLNEEVNQYDYIVFTDEKYFLSSTSVSFFDEIIETSGRKNSFLSFPLLSDVYLLSASVTEVKQGGEGSAEVLPMIDSGFQIWKNSYKNKELLKEILLSTKTEYEMKKWRNSYPFEVIPIQKMLSEQKSEDKKKKDRPSVDVTILQNVSSFLCPISSFSSDYLDRVLTLQILESVSLTTTKGLLKQHPQSSNELLFQLSSSHYDFFLSFPESWLFISYLLKDINNEDFTFEMIVKFDNNNIAFFMIQYREKIPDYCSSFLINGTECVRLIRYMEEKEKEKRNEVQSYHMNQFYQKFMKRNPDYLIVKGESEKESNEAIIHSPVFDGQETTRQMTNSGLTAPLIHSRRRQRSRVIFTVFAGRKNRLDLLMRYLQLGLQLHLIDEVHLWDYCREEVDRIALLSFINPSQGIFLRTKYTNRQDWTDYYHYYDNHGKLFPNDIIIKCDDDITFIDIFELPYFLSLLRDDEKRRITSGEREKKGITGVLFANIINNGVASYYQQHHWNFYKTSEENMILEEDMNEEILKEDLEYPPGGLCGSLWESGKKANILHNYFLNHWKEIIRPSSSSSSSAATAVIRPFYQPEILPIETRFSINFFGIKASNWYKLRDVGYDDELHISVSLPLFNISRNYLASNFIVSHLSFRSQRFDVNEKLQRYHQLFEEYSQNVSLVSSENKNI